MLTTVIPTHYHRSTCRCAEQCVGPFVSQLVCLPAGFIRNSMMTDWFVGFFVSLFLEERRFFIWVLHICISSIRTTEYFDKHGLIIIQLWDRMKFRQRHWTHRHQKKPRRTGNGTKNIHGKGMNPSPPLPLYRCRKINKCNGYDCVLIPIRWRSWINRGSHCFV